MKIDRSSISTFNIPQTRGETRKKYNAENVTGNELPYQNLTRQVILITIDTLELKPQVRT